MGIRKKALITGGTHGIGLAIAEKLASNGFDLVIGSRTQKRIEEATDYLSKYDVSVDHFSFDGTNLTSVDEVIKDILPRFQIDILINNVGGGGRWGDDDILQTEWNIWERVYNKNVNTAIKFILAVLPNMVKNRWGRVITISSIYGKEAGGRPWYNVAKSAQIALMKNLSKNTNFVRNGITFNTICPGSIMIEETGWATVRDEDPQKFHELINQNYPMGHLGAPEDVAGIAGFLCQHEACHINGAVITVDGGESSGY